MRSCPKFQECVRQVRRAGAKVNESCGLHIHVDAANHNRQSLKNLLSIMYSKEDILFKALQVNEARAARWCQKVRGTHAAAGPHPLCRGNQGSDAVGEHLV